MKKTPLFSPSVGHSESAPKKKTPPKKAETKAPLFSPSLEETPIEEESGIKDTALDVAYAAAQGGTFNLADEAYGAGRSLYEEGDLSKYETHRDDARERWAMARERTPVGTTIGEIGGAIVSPASKLVGPVKGLRGVIRGATEGGLQAYGASDADTLKEQAIDAGKGAGLGAAVGVIANTATQRYAKSPNATRAEVLGVKGRDYLVDGPGDRKQIVQRITDSGMLKNRKMEYDPEKLTFVPKGKNKWTLDEIEANTEDRLLGRASDAVEKLQMRKDRDYGRLLDGRFVPMADVDQMVMEIADEYSKRGLHKGPMDRNAAVFAVGENIKDQIMNIGGDMGRVSLRQLDTLKRMAQEDVKNFSKGLGELGDSDELARITARKLKNLVENRIGNEGFKKINSAQHDFLTISGDLKNKIRGLDLAVPARQQLEKTNMLEGLVDSAMGRANGRLDAADMKDWWQKHIPKPARAVVPYAAEEAPGVLYRQNFEGQNTPQGNWRNPSSIQNIPEELIRTPLPRTTKELMEKKDFVLMKVAQMMPEAFDGVKDAFENNPEDLGTLAQVIAQKMPQFFTKDKYNRFDGRIVTEQDKQKAIKDTMLRKDISAIEQGKIITRLNQEGTFE